MEISDKGIEFIKNSEGYKLVGYLDQAGVPTVGVGHTGVGIYEGMIITSEQADEYLKQDLKKFVTAINSLVKVELNQNQMDALTSFCFNEGVHAFSTSTLLKKLNANDLQGTANEFLKWDIVAGVHNHGVEARRIRERNLFNEKI